MKRYYALWEKILLFLAAMICGFVTVVAGIGCVGMMRVGIYGIDETTYIENEMQSLVYDQVSEIAWNPEFRAGTPSNLIYRVFDESGKITAQYGDITQDHWGNYVAVYRNTENGQECVVTDLNRISWDVTTVSPQQIIEEIYKDLQTTYDFEEYARQAEEGKYELNYRLVQVAIGKNLPVQDEVNLQIYLIQQAFRYRYLALVAAGIGLILTLICFGYLLAGAGHHYGSEELFPGPADRIPWDVMIFGYLCLSTICIAGTADWMSWQGLPDLRNVTVNMWFSQVLGLILVASAAILAEGAITLGMCLTTASRFKRKVLLKNTLILWSWEFLRKCVRTAGRWAGRVIGYLPMMWKVLAAYGVLSLLEFIGIVIFANDGAFFLLWLLEKILLLAGLIWLCLILKQLKSGGEALAAGNLDYKMDTSGMLWDLKEHGDNLNRIGEGMNVAVQERLKSERMKTELITNVSHDIKTPLTSIINYASLIAAEPTENAKVKEYTQVLVRQSEKLKRLIEDLVEASKASTGNLDVELMPCDAAVFVEQAGGEYEEKLARLNLQLITDVPKEEVTIQADGRRMWRIFDNLINNICKYSLSGSRVYLSLKKLDGMAVFTFRNVSREPLNITPEELMERFTRGDSSRHTEGNGLGLSIARSMAELQGGTLELSIDGDLFKAILSFPVA